MIKISIIVPTCNRANRLTNAIQSFILQEFPVSRYEILVVDNGSTDHTEKAARAAKSNNQTHNIKYIFEPVPGLLSGRHRGALEAEGEILVFVDDDIEATPQWLSAIEEAFKDESIHLVGGPSLPNFEVDPPDWISKYWNKQGDNITCGSLSLLNLGNEKLEIDPIYVWGLNFAIRKKTLFDLGGFHPDCIPKDLQHFQGDGETGLAFKLKKNGSRAIYTPGAKVCHHIPRERLTVMYFETRFYYQGVCDSYTKIRRNQGLSNIGIPDSKADDRNLSGLSAYEQYKQIIYQRIRNAYAGGFLFHQDAVKKSEILLRWVLRENYFDYKLPDLPAVPKPNDNITNEERKYQCHGQIKTDKGLSRFP